MNFKFCASNVRKVTRRQKCDLARKCHIHTDQNVTMRGLTPLTDFFETTTEATPSEYSTAPPRDSKKRMWKCKRIVAGPKEYPPGTVVTLIPAGQQFPDYPKYSTEELTNLENDWEQDNAGSTNPFVSAPTGPPTGPLFISGPEDIEFWDPSRPSQFGVERSRDPQFPSLQNWQDKTTGKWYAAFLYNYIEEEFDNTFDGGNEP